jgi:uncharacterized cupin superfamily protein
MPRIVPPPTPPFAAATGYAPPEHDPGPFASIAVGELGGLTRFGVRIETLPPGSASSMRHWHSEEDEFVMVLDGDLALVEDTGETPMGPGAAAGFAHGRPNGHHLVNRSAANATFLVAGNRWPEDICTYSGQDRQSRRQNGESRVTRRDGAPLARADEPVPRVEDPVPDAPGAAIDIGALTRFTGASYPPPHDAAMARRSWVRLGAAAGLTRLGVNLVTVAPGGLSSARHWHTGIDEFLILRAGRLTLIEDDGETPMLPGECAAFPAGNGVGHHLRNDGAEDAVFLVMSDVSDTDTCHYSDIDLVAHVDGPRRWYRLRDGAVIKEF